MLAVEVAEYLDGLGLVNYDPTGMAGDTFLEFVPASPDEVVVITDYPGPQPDPKHGYDTPNVQVRTRAGRDPRVARATLDAIFNALHNLHAVTLPGGTYVVSCWAIQSGPTPLGPDQNGRFEYTLNFQFHVRNVTAHRV